MLHNFQSVLYQVCNILRFPPHTTYSRNSVCNENQLMPFRELIVCSENNRKNMRCVSKMEIV